MPDDRGLSARLREMRRYLSSAYNEEFLSVLTEAADALDECGDFIAEAAAHTRERVNREEGLREALVVIARIDSDHGSEETVRATLRRARGIAETAVNEWGGS